jgi:hypothetical protein
VRANICRQRNSSAEAEDDAERIHSNIHNRDAELVDEGCRQEVHQCEQPPYTNEQRVVDDRVCAPVSARNDVTHECGNENSADQLDTVNEALQMMNIITYLEGTEAHGNRFRHHFDDVYVVVNVEDVVVE